MKKPYICTLIGSFGRDYVLIFLFQLESFQDESFWVDQYDIIPNLHIVRKTNPI